MVFRELNILKREIAIRKWNVNETTTLVQQ